MTASSNAVRAVEHQPNLKEVPPNSAAYVIDFFEPENRCLKQKDLTVNEQIVGPSVDPSGGSFVQDLMPLLNNYDSMKMSINIDQFWRR